MCQDCGCSLTDSHQHTHKHNDNSLENIHLNPQLNDKKTVDVIQKILDKNDHEASHNRSHFENTIF